MIQSKHACQLLLFLVFVLCTREQASAQATVPRVWGKTTREAAQLARLSELQSALGVYYVAPRHWSDEIRHQVVYIQTPQPGTVVPRNATVACWTLEQASADQAVVQTPKLVGLTAKAAAEKIAAAKLAGVRFADNPAPHKGRVIDQYPRHGQSVYAGTSVYFIVTSVQRSSSSSSNRSAISRRSDDAGS